MDTSIEAPEGRTYALQALMPCLHLTPGLKIAYVTDVVYSAENARRIIDLAHEADWLYIESVFLDEDADRAAAKMHLTAGQAGRLALAAGARIVVPFHFSPIYREREAALREELRQASGHDKVPG